MEIVSPGDRAAPFEGRRVRVIATDPIAFGTTSDRPATLSGSQHSRRYGVRMLKMLFNSQSDYQIPSISRSRNFSGNDFPFLIAHISLYNAEGSSPVDVIGPGGQTPSQQRLYGNLVSSPQTLRNLQGRLGVYFLFPDVSIRWSGRFTLSVTLMRIPRYGLYGGYSYLCSMAW